MPWSGGTYRKGNYGSNGWTGDASLGIGIEAGRHDTQDDDFATGISNCIAKDGTNYPTSDLNMNNQRHTAVGNATARNHYAALGQIQDGSVIWCGTAGGTANALTLTPSPAITTYVAGQRFLFLAAANNTAAATLQVSGIATPRDIYLASTNGAAPAGFIRTGALCEVVYDGSRFLLTKSVAEMLGGQFTALGTSTGTANAIVLTPSVPVLTYSQPQVYSFFKDATTNNGACTINISGLGVINLLDREGNALKAGMLQANRVYNILINGSAYLLNPSSVWTAFSPTLTQSATVTYTGNSNYKLIDNNTVVWEFNLTATSAGTATNPIQLTLPLTAAWSGTYSCVGSANILKLSTVAIYTCTAALATTGTLRFFSGSGTTANNVGAVPAITLASGDVIAGTITYRVA
jgi:hypothetical protein